MKFPGLQTPETCCILRICQMIKGIEVVAKSQESAVENSSKTLCVCVHTHIHRQTDKYCQPTIFIVLSMHYLSGTFKCGDLVMILI